MTVENSVSEVKHRRLNTLLQPVNIAKALYLVVNFDQHSSNWQSNNRSQK